MSSAIDAALVASLFAVDPAGLGGVRIHSPPHPVRERWLALLRTLLPAPGLVRRLPCTIGDERLLGGLDLTATLRSGRPVAERGVLAETDGGVIVLAMAERLPALTAARIVAAIDEGEVRIERDGVALRSPARLGVVALDEGESAEESAPAALLDRLAFRLDLRAFRAAELLEPAHSS
ncbi:MAG: magnesium chelatase ATPase subunit D, partial [Gammaproteobacteria bacterium]|nr:magnesium chelatase ATPase subunit D [Gammaproteobacteria bacterium]